MNSRWMALGLLTLGAVALIGIALPGGVSAAAACSFHVRLVAPSHAALGQPVTLQTQLIASSSACHAYGAMYHYSGLPLNVNPMNGPVVTFMPQMPGALHIAVVVTSSLGTSAATATVVVQAPTS